MSFPQSNAERRKKLETLSKFFETKKHGEVVTWLDIEQATGVPMHPSANPNRSLAREALDRMKWPYDTIWGAGFRLSSADIASEIVDNKFGRVMRATKRVGRTADQLNERHNAEFSYSQRMDLAGKIATMGAIRALQVNTRFVTERKKLGK